MSSPLSAIWVGNLKYATGLTAPQLQVPTEPGLKFHNFQHSYVCDFIKTLNAGGISDLFNLDLTAKTDGGSTFKQYSPNAELVDTPWPVSKVEAEQADMGEAHWLYNREIFFHAAMLVAGRLSTNQKFSDAQQWYHYIFDPTRPSPSVWKFFPFAKDETQDVQDILTILASPDDSDEKQSLLCQLGELSKHPFEPHQLARFRQIAYKQYVVMKYLDNLIAWGDSLFMQDSIESINEATQTYVLAADILGDRPEIVPPRGNPEPETYASLRLKLQAQAPANNQDASHIFSDVMVTFENEMPYSSLAAGQTSSDGNPYGNSTALYFCAPQNDKLLGYFDLVQDRLYKIRHCENIAGVERQLALFEPPIDPAILVKAAAAGVDLNSILSDLSAPLPHYRFNVMLQKAVDLCSEVKALGQALLSVLEKQDAEGLALLRSSNEINVLQAARVVKAKQVDEAQATFDGLQKYQIVVQARQTYYSTIQSRIEEESQQLDLLETSLGLQTAQAVLEYVAFGLYLVPDFKVGFPTTDGATYGGANIGHSVERFAAALGATAGVTSTAASLVSTKGSFKRRQDDWTHQADLATKELAQVDRQIAAAQCRLDIANTELQNHDTQIDNAKAVDDYMRNKFTNQDLYDWMRGQVSEVYFKSYQLAYSVAKRAERAYRAELGFDDSDFVNFGYWDSAQKGLLAGDQLYHDIKRMEVSYLDQNQREKELVLTYSLALNDPLALLKLKQTGECVFEIREDHYDKDFLAQYYRRIRCVSVSLPCVTGPYTTVATTLTLLKNSCRVSSSLGDDYARNLEDEDDRFNDNLVAIQSICTSTGQNDFGLHEFKFEDPRYNPFEFGGAISQWRLELMKDKDLRQFDYETISDVVLHIRYTARDGGGRLQAAAAQALKDVWTGATDGTQPQMRLFSVRHEFPTEWHRFLSSTDEIPRLQLNLQSLHFPYPFRDKSLSIAKVGLFSKRKDSAEPLNVWLTKSGADENPPYVAVTDQNGVTTKTARQDAASVLRVNPMLGVLANIEDLGDSPPTILGDDSTEAQWLIMTDGSPGELEDLWFLVCYTANPS